MVRPCFSGIVVVVVVRMDPVRILLTTLFGCGIRRCRPTPTAPYYISHVLAHIVEKITKKRKPVVFLTKRMSVVSEKRVFTSSTPGHKIGLHWCKHSRITPSKKHRFHVRKNLVKNVLARSVANFQRRYVCLGFKVEEQLRLRFEETSSIAIGPGLQVHVFSRHVGHQVFHIEAMGRTEHIEKEFVEIEKSHLDGSKRSHQKRRQVDFAER